MGQPMCRGFHGEKPRPCGLISLGVRTPWAEDDANAFPTFSAVLRDGRGMAEMTLVSPPAPLGCLVSHAAPPSDSQAAELFSTLVSELQGLSPDELRALWRQSSFKCRDNW